MSDELVIYVLMRNDLDMSTGKQVAQGGHAVTNLLFGLNTDTRLRYDYMTRSQTKIVLKVDSEQELVDVMNAAQTEGHYGTLVRDQGRIEVEAGSLTCGAIGPVVKSKARQLLKDLKTL